MPELLNTLSELIEFGRTTLSATDFEGLPAEHRAMLLSQGLLVPTCPAKHLTCDACHNDHVEEVTRVKFRNGRTTFRLLCSEAGWVEVPSERLRQWTVDHRRLVSLLATGLETGCVPKEIIAGSVWSLGSVEYENSVYEVLVVFNQPDGDNALEQLCQSVAPRRTILLTSGIAVANADFALSIPFSEAFKVTEDQVQFESSRVRALLSTNRPVQKFVFRLIGEYWQIIFDGKENHLQDVAGLTYISRLIQEPHRDIPAVSLMAARTGIDPRFASLASIKLLEDEDRIKYTKLYQEQMEELSEAEKNNDSGRVIQLQENLNAFTMELARATGLGGKARENSDFQKICNSVSMAVTRAIDRIAAKDAAFGRHLENTISKGLMFRYSPEKDIDWLT